MIWIYCFLLARVGLIGLDKLVVELTELVKAIRVVVLGIKVGFTDTGFIIIKVKVIFLVISTNQIFANLINNSFNFLIKAPKHYFSTLTSITTRVTTAFVATFVVIAFGTSFTISSSTTDNSTFRRVDPCSIMVVPILII